MAVIPGQIPLTYAEVDLSDLAPKIEPKITIIRHSYHPEPEKGDWSVWFRITMMPFVRTHVMSYDFFHGDPSTEALKEFYLSNAQPLCLDEHNIIVDTGIRLGSEADIIAWSERNSEQTEDFGPRRVIINFCTFGELREP